MRSFDVGCRFVRSAVKKDTFGPVPVLIQNERAREIGIPDQNLSFAKIYYSGLPLSLVNLSLSDTSDV